MTPRQILDCAQRLLAGSEEADWRGAVSRGYYAAFHATIALFRSIRFRAPADAGAHKYLTDRLIAAGFADWVNAGQELSRLRDDRNEADYDLNVSFGLFWAEQILDRVDDYFDLLDQLRADPALLNAVQAIRAYDQGLGPGTYFGP
ncbi:MAG: hypothetical protein ACRC33_09410 [Gemmataceae bacterium]